MKRDLSHFILFLCFLINISCSHHVYTGEGRLDVLIDSPKSQKKEVVIFEKQYESLLWGKIPGEYKIDLGDELLLSNINKVGKIEVIQYQSAKDQLLTIFSLGLYIPYHVKVIGWGEKLEF